MNKKYFLLTCLAAFPFALTAQENNRYEEITNPKLTSINREPARSTFTSYVTEADAVINDRKNGTFRLSLNGKWKFHYVETFADRPIRSVADLDRVTGPVTYIEGVYPNGRAISYSLVQ